MEGVSAAEAIVISKIQSSEDVAGVHSFYSGHLRSFAPFFKRAQTTAKKAVKHSKSNPSNGIRSLAKQFLPFVHKSLSILPKRLSGSPKIPRESAVELFEVYRVCLDCLDVMAPELDGEPHSVQVQRIRFLHSLEHWELYEEAEDECFLVLRNLRVIFGDECKSNLKKNKSCFLPVVKQDKVHSKTASIILEVVVTLIKCASKRKIMEDDEYRRVVALVEESEPWFKILDIENYKKFHHFMVTYLHMITLFLVGELKSFNVDLICEFCRVTFKEYMKSNAPDQMYKVAMKICSLIFSLTEKMHYDPIVTVLNHVLSFMSAESKSGVEKTACFLDLVHYCVKKSQSVSAGLCDQVARQLHKLAVDLFKDLPFISSIIRLYEIGLITSSLHNRLNEEYANERGNGPFGSIHEVSFIEKEKLPHVAACLELFEGHFGICDEERKLQKKECSFASYWEALKFFCQSMAESINSKRKWIFCAADISTSWNDLACIHDAFLHYCCIYTRSDSVPDVDIEACEDNQRVIPLVGVASLILAFRTHHKFKESTRAIKVLISIDWDPCKGLKQLYISLNNLASVLQQNKWLNEATKALNLSCRALWKYVVCLCEGHDSHLPENDAEWIRVISDLVGEASEKTAFLLRLNKDSNCKVRKVVAESLRCWCAAHNLIPTVPYPLPLINQWVKIQCMKPKDDDVENEVTLYSLLSSPDESSNVMTGKLLEQEIISYDENSNLSPEYSLRMRLKIMSFLIDEVYDAECSLVDKCRILIKKAKALRSIGKVKLDECIQCLTVAISTLKPIHNAKRSCCYEVRSLLIYAYVLHAICTHEAEPRWLALSSKSKFLQEIQDALKLASCTKHIHDDEQHEDMLYLWYQVIDVLSIKGFLEMHACLYDVVIPLSVNKITFTKVFCGLWKSKRLSHSLCALPINPIFKNTFAKYHEDPFDSSGFWRTCMEELKNNVVGFGCSTLESKKAAVDLLSNVPLTSDLVFLASTLYYELAERFISSAQMSEALTYAKEAHSLRGKLLRQYFEYSIDKTMETYDEYGHAIEKSYYSIQAFNVIGSMVIKNSFNVEGCVLSPWNVLSCYLESVLQVALIHEVLGNVSEAETLLLWGKDISQFQGLLHFQIYFSSILGKMYLKQKLWSTAEKELSTAKKNLTDNYDSISCKQCSCALEVFINQQIGDLLYCKYSSSCESTSELFTAKSWYRSALEKLACSNWTFSGDANARPDAFVSCQVSARRMKDCIVNDACCTKPQGRKGRKTKAEAKSTNRKFMVGGNNRRITRSMDNSDVETQKFQHGRQIQSSGLSFEELSGAIECSDQPTIGFDSTSTGFLCGLASVCKNLRCWHCLHIEAMQCTKLSDFVQIHSELAFRKICSKLLVSLGKFAGACGNVHEAHKILQTSSLVFLGQNCCSKHSADFESSLEAIGKDFPGDVLAIERATVIYYICWFSLKSLPSHGARKNCCKLPCIGVAGIIYLLKMAFVLSQEVPLQMQKISRLLAALYVLAASLNHLSFSSSYKCSESQWAAFFHQASLGTPLNQQISLGQMQKWKNETAKDLEVHRSWKSFSTNQCSPCSTRNAPESCEDLEKFVLRFLQDLPSTPIICISAVAGAEGVMISELSNCSPKQQSWILISHLSADSQHSILLPLNNTLRASSTGPVISECKDFTKQWRCPWVSTLIDDIAPGFRYILEGNYYSSSKCFLEHVGENVSLWWTQRSELDECLSKFLEDAENLWLGAWKHLLLGEWPECISDDCISNHLSQEEEHMLQLILAKRCYLRVGCDPSSSSFERAIHLLFMRKHEALRNFPDDENMRKPIILVLDFEVQMLPWESLPILRGQEVYRMPSVGCIQAIINGGCRTQGQSETITAPFPLIDPQDSYYLLNPDGDLSRTQTEFHDWFKDQNMEGNAGAAPTVGELSLALRNHDLFIYCGHGSGMQYIPGHEIQKLEKCAATLLLGCCSGSLYLKGSYMPQGAPISYLLAGAPVIIANLWEVTDKDIDRFGKAMLNAWMRERAADCSQCKVCKLSTRCIHRPRVGSFMAQARDACALRFLIGAAPVCYGVPTGIIKREKQVTG